MDRHVTLPLLGLVCLAVNSGCSLTMPDPSLEAVSPSLRTRALGLLLQAVREEEGWVKVHAAEGLPQNGYPQGVAMVFERDLASAEPAYRERSGVSA